MSSSKDISKKSALKFVIILSIVSLFADMTYEGARSITGPYLAVLGANAAIVGFVAGFGELIGYSLRFISGYIADQTKKYWTITIIGYCINLLAVPCLALAGHWWVAAILIIMERAGKAIRAPSLDAMLSHAGQKMGSGWVFGLHEAIDQIGGFLGPLLIALILYFKGSYQEGFATLLIPAIAALIILSFARYLYPHPQKLEIQNQPLETKGIKKTFWLYLIGSSLIAAGYADFSLMAYHFEKQHVLTSAGIPIFYGIALGFTSITSPILGHLYDRYGFIILIFSSIISLFFTPFVFLGNEIISFIGITLWSIGISAHESLMRSIIADLIPPTKRASAYGLFNTFFGISWFIGSFLMGILYDKSINYLVIFSVTSQIVAILILYITKINFKKYKK